MHIYIKIFFIILSIFLSSCAHIKQAEQKNCNSVDICLTYKEQNGNTYSKNFKNICDTNKFIENNSVKDYYLNEGICNTNTENKN